MKTPAQIAAAFGCTPAQAKAQLQRNAQGLEAMAAKAGKTGRKVNGYTQAQLIAMAANARKAANS